MKTVRTIADVRRAVADARAGGCAVGLVPTMGALHAGHLSLLAAARSQCDFVVMSLFVNPAQFAAGEDLDGYPRDEAADAAAARTAGVDLLFAPAVEEMYPEGFATSVTVGGVSERLEGVGRGAGHFAGVATVVTKLLNIVAPDVAYFGQKDAQQVAVIKRLVTDLDLRPRIAVCPTVRGDDGLACSSRNVYLSPQERQRAAGISRALARAQALIAAGERDVAAIASAAHDVLADHEIEAEYLELVDADTLGPVATIDRPVLIALAARIGRARLIDNVIATPVPERVR